MNREVTQTQFDNLRTTLSQSESAVREVPISMISVDGNCLKKDQILVGGEPVRIGKSFLSKLGSMLKINRGLTRDMINKGDHRLAAMLINGLKDYQSKNKRDSSVVLIANLNTKEVVDICQPSRYRRATNDTVLDITERILNDNPNLSLETVDWDAASGKSSINFLNNKEVGFAQAGKDEFFKFGFSIVQTTKDTIVEGYNQRLICTNGLRTSLGQGQIGANKSLNFTDKFRLGGTGTEDVRIFLNQLEEMKRLDYVNPMFESAINRAVSTKASLAEVESAFMASISKIDEIDPDLKNTYRSSIARSWYHAYGDTQARIHRKGRDYAGLNQKQKQFIKTGMSVWDVVNSLTFLGSNNSGIDLENKHELKYLAGDLFSKGVKDGYDLEFAQYASL